MFDIDKSKAINSLLFVMRELGVETQDIQDTLFRRPEAFNQIRTPHNRRYLHKNEIRSRTVIH